MDITIKGRNLLTTYHHYIMRMNNKDMKRNEEYRKLNVVRITEENINLCDGAFYSVGSLKQFLSGEYIDKVEGYMILDPITEKCISYIWVAFPESDMYCYRIRRASGYLFRLSTFPEYRRQGYGGNLMRWVSDYVLREHGVDTLTFAVKTDNTTAIHCYERVGFAVIGEKRFVRFLRRNIPYYTL